MESAQANAIDMFSGFGTIYGARQRIDRIGTDVLIDITKNTKSDQEPALA
jgi:hypothetical protein